MSLLQIQDLVYEANAHHATRILDGLSLSVEGCEVHALIGTNGTGKSTLASVIMGCEGYGPASGDVVFDGRPLAGLKVLEHVPRNAWEIRAHEQVSAVIRFEAPVAAWIASELEGEATDDAEPAVRPAKPARA